MSAEDQDLFGTMIKVENKDIFVDLRQNNGGIYLKLSERNGKSRNTVLIPASGISRLAAALEKANEVINNTKTVRVSAERKNRIASDPGVVSRSVYVSGLSWETNNEMLSAHFSGCGKVKSAAVLYKTRAGKTRSLGCGVVEFSSSTEAAKAIAKMNDTTLDGRIIKCRADRNVGDDEAAAVGGDASASSALPGASSSSSASSPTAGAGATAKKAAAEATAAPEEDKVVDPLRIYVGSLPFNTTGEDLASLFSLYGAVVNAEIHATAKGRSLGRGVVEFATPAAAAEAIEQVNGREFQGRKITVRAFFQN